MECLSKKQVPLRCTAMLCLVSLTALQSGCRNPHAAVEHTYKTVPPSVDETARSVAEHRAVAETPVLNTIRQTAFQSDETAATETAATETAATETDATETDATPEDTAALDPPTDIAVQTETAPPQVTVTADSLAELETAALTANPKLIGMTQQVQAAWAKTRSVDRLPDPSIGANVFGDPIETASGSQRANLSVMQMVPWLDRLEAQQRQACFEALVMQQMLNAERLRVVADVRANFFRLYVLQKQLESLEANQQLLQILIDVASARVANGGATQGDVLLGTLELSRLEEERLMLRQQLASTSAELNRLLNRPTDIPVTSPRELQVVRPDWTPELLRQTALQQQPMIAAAMLRTNATRWGVEVAELRQRPDFTLSASWFVIDDNRPPSAIVGVGNDAWSLGASMTVPIGRDKYDAIRDEARWKHMASHADVQDVIREFDSKLLDLLQQAQAAAETVTLYRDTIIPQAEQTLRADQASLADGAVEFDRVIQDVRKLLTLEFGYHRTIGNLAIANARIQQATGTNLSGEVMGTDLD